MIKSLSAIFFASSITFVGKNGRCSTNVAGAQKKEFDNLEDIKL
jgi:hypothetical protein